MKSSGTEVVSEDYLIKSVVRMSFKEREEDKDFINNLLRKVNDKDYGEIVEVDKLILHALRSIGEKHLEKLKENSISPEEKLEDAYKKEKEKNNYKGTFYEWMCLKAKV